MCTPYVHFRCVAQQLPSGFSLTITNEACDWSGKNFSWPAAMADSGGFGCSVGTPGGWGCHNIPSIFNLAPHKKFAAGRTCGESDGKYRFRLGRRFTPC